jgi:hypothetical protein
VRPKALTPLIFSRYGGGQGLRLAANLMRLWAEA